VADLPLVSRRTALRLLAVGALGLLTACRPTRSPTATATSGSPAATGTSTPSVHGSQAAPTRADLAVKRAAAGEQALLLAYDAAAGQHPELADRLAPLRADHAAHLVALTPGAPAASASQPPSLSPSVTPGLAEPTSPVGSGPPPLGSPPGSAGTSTTNAGSAASDLLVVLAGLASLERQAAAARLDDLAATSGSLAMVLASIGGCEAAHAALLVPA
jgi:hypothetical protein